MLEVIFEYVPFVVTYFVLTFCKWILSLVLRRRKKKNPQDKSIPKLEKKLKKISEKLESKIKGGD